MALRAFKDVDHGYRKTVAAVGTLRRGPIVKVGVQGSDADKDHGGLTVAELAAIHEFGLGDAQERSFIRGWVDENREAIKQRLASLARRVIKAELTPEQALAQFGEWAVGQIKERMLRGLGSPPRTLVDTGQLISSITAMVQS